MDQGIKVIRTLAIFFTLCFSLTPAFAGVFQCIRENLEKLRFRSGVVKEWTNSEFVDALEREANSFAELKLPEASSGQAIDFIQTHFVNNPKTNIMQLMGFVLASFSQEERRMILEILQRNLSNKKIRLVKLDSIYRPVFSNVSGYTVHRHAWFSIDRNNIDMRFVGENFVFKTREQALEGIQNTLVQMHALGQTNYSPRNIVRY